MTKTKNKRTTTRYSCAVPVDSKKGAHFDDTITTDVSKGGMGFISMTSVPLRRKIAVQLDLSPEDDPILAIGKVQWVSPIPDSDHYRVGLSFENIFSGSKTRLERFFWQ